MVTVAIAAPDAPTTFDRDLARGLERSEAVAFADCTAVPAEFPGKITAD
jgi:hypothetical protein